ncbi:XrtV sorting system accessory protein [Sphingomonas sp. NPDC079357]|jgi:hypothetical protein|uniref:XrtV sorting system accessory protein n=1 Tax=Sphingomonas sp. NPDC079357 TaxID=3364518 RepID=UPI00384E2FB9
METVYDWVTLAIFAGLVVLFLQRSMADDHQDSMIAYLAGAAMCALANYLGNDGHDLLASLLIVANLAFILLVLKPIELPRRS